jgi:hypothetical protein
MLSLFAYPGSGHLLLKRKGRGAFWATFFTISLLLCFGIFFSKLARLYGAATTSGSLNGFDLASWMPMLCLAALTASLWMLTALDVLWLALWSPAANAHVPAEVLTDQQFATLNPQVNLAPEGPA